MLPISIDGNILLPQSSLPGELWPMLLAKAVCTLLEPSYQERLDIPEFGDACIAHLLTGWMPEIIKIDPEK